MKFEKKNIFYIELIDLYFYKIKKKNNNERNKHENKTEHCKNFNFF